MTELFWMGFAAGVLLGGFLGLVLAGLLRMSSDLELRMAHHVRNSDEHEDLIKPESREFWIVPSREKSVWQLYGFDSLEQAEDFTNKDTREIIKVREVIDE